ncbi:MAG: tetratricopeptide repeat protein, partial [Planctomycetaceae bacterium]
DVRFLNNLAWTMAENLQRYDDGLKVIDEAIGRIGKRPAFLDTRGVIYTRMGRYKDAIADLEAAREASTLISDGQPIGAIHFHLARAYLLNGQADKAKEMITAGKALGLNDGQLEPTEMDDYRKLTASR